jgi:hypothetical protein
MSIERVRRFAVVGLATAIVVAVALTTAQRGGSPARAEGGGGTPTNVNAFGCTVVNGGRVTRPAGSMIVIRSGWLTGTSGAVTSFQLAQTSILSVNDGVMVDVSGEYDDPAPTGDGNWVTFLHHPSGVTLANPGDTMRFTFALLFDRRLSDVFDLDGDGTPDPTRAGPGLSFGGTCTVTAV